MEVTPLGHHLVQVVRVFLQAFQVLLLHEAVAAEVVDTALLVVAVLVALALAVLDVLVAVLQGQMALLV